MSSAEDCLAMTASLLDRSATSMSLLSLRRIYEVGLVALFVVALARSWRMRGLAVTARELIFGFLVSQCVELMAVAIGRYRYPDWLVYFPPRPAWVPLAIGLGWAAILPTVMRVSERILDRHAAPWRLALLDGAMALGIDLMLDPAVSGPPLRMWLWRGDGMTPYRFWLLDVPLFNFVGWFVLVSACSLELRLVEARLATRRWMWLGLFLVANLALAGALMALPW